MREEGWVSLFFVVGGFSLFGARLALVWRGNADLGVAGCRRDIEESERSGGERRGMRSILGEVRTMEEESDRRRRASRPGRE